LNAPVLLLGEAAGDEEARTGIPFAGPAGGMLNRLLGRNHWDRNAVRIANVIQCQPPNNWFDERAPWYWGARNHCAVHRGPVLAEPHQVIVALGATAAKLLIGMDKGYRVEDHHGCVHETSHGLVIPTFHPSHLQRGAHNLFGCVSFDLQQAWRVAKEGWEPEQPSIVVDPPVDWFRSWVEVVEAACLQEPESIWLTVDIETPDKSDGQDEGELSSEDRSYTILRVNFSVHPDEGISVPYAGPYVALIDRLLRCRAVVLGWNFEYDRPRLEAAGHVLNGVCLDFMWLWHYLQSDLPRGLGFAAPFYSRFGAWKHLAKGEPGTYAAIDGFQTYRIATGIARDLQGAGQWDRAIRHVHRLHEVALKPAQQVGLLVSRDRLNVFIADLEVKQRRILHQMQGMVPEDCRPLTPKGGYKRAPEEGKVHAKGTSVKRDGSAKKEAPDPVKQELYAQTAVLVERQQEALVLVCRTCGATDVQRRHACQPASTTVQPVSGGRHANRVQRERTADVELETRTVVRWYWQEPFNPDSPDQILAYLKFRGHKPGKAKKSGQDSTDRDTLKRLVKETKDPLYQAILDSRAIGKVRGTYGEGTRKLMDSEDRVHPVPTFRPSTMRLSYTSPNITNVVADKGGKEGLASGFRACIVAGEELPGWVTPAQLKSWEARWCVPT
jgi:uracil-DNA glycosylase family 4